VSRVLIADDHAVVRVGYKQFLEADAIITEIGEASSGNDTLDHLRRKEWDLLLMDIHMPDRSGLDVLKYVVKGYPDVRILIISGLPEEQFARSVLRAGASGYLSKGSSAEEFMKAVHTVLMGRRYISASLAEAMAADLELPRDQNQPLHARLSAREFQIFYKLASGVGVSNIARELSLSVKTVSTYRTRIVEKMAFDSNADMTTYALRNGIIQ
jgi:two-component system, NarL family, invasion response regulator UvrY